MVNDLLARLNRNLDGYKPLIASDIPSTSLSVVEGKLLTSAGAYVRGKPPDYPSSPTEAIGARRINNLGSGKYQGMNLKTGTTTLHIRDAQNYKNIEAVVLYMDGNEELEFKGTQTVGRTPSPVAMATILENGVISAYYQSSTIPVPVTANWFPKSAFVLWPYPRNHSGIEEIMKKGLGKYRMSENTAAFQAIPHMIMLCADTFAEVNKDAARLEHYGRLTELVEQGLFAKRIYGSYLDKLLHRARHYVSPIDLQPSTDSDDYVVDLLKRGQAMGKLIPSDGPVCLEDGFAVVFLDNSNQQDIVATIFGNVEDDSSGLTGSICLGGLGLVGVDEDGFSFAQHEIIFDLVKGDLLEPVKDDVRLGILAQYVLDSTIKAIKQFALIQKPGILH